MVSDLIPDNHSPEPPNRNLGRQYERVARTVNARHTAGQMLRRYRRPPTLAERLDTLERENEQIKAALYELLRIAA